MRKNTDHNKLEICVLLWCIKKLINKKWKKNIGIIKIIKKNIKIAIFVCRFIYGSKDHVQMSTVEIIKFVDTEFTCVQNS